MTKGAPAAGGNFFEFIINTLGSKQFVVAFLALSCASTHAPGVLPNRVKLKKRISALLTLNKYFGFALKYFGSLTPPPP